LVERGAHLNGSKGQRNLRVVDIASDDKWVLGDSVKILMGNRVDAAFFFKKTGTGKLENGKKRKSKNSGNGKTGKTGKKKRENGKREIFKNNCYINFKNLWINNKQPVPSFFCPDRGKICVFCSDRGNICFFLSDRGKICVFCSDRGNICFFCPTGEKFVFFVPIEEKFVFFVRQGKNLCFLFR
jgi:hypothetical protein